MSKRTVTHFNLNLFTMYIFRKLQNLKRIVIPCLLLTIIVFASCKTDKFDEHIIYLTSDKEINQLSDSTFFSSTKCMVEYDGYIYASLSQRMQIICMDKNLQLKKTIGKHGRGPQEFIYIDCFSIYDSILWVGNTGQLALMKFSITGDYIGTERKTSEQYPLNQRFAIDNNKIYFSQVNVDKHTSLAILDLNDADNTNYIEFGEFTDFGQGYKSYEQNKRDVFITDDYIIAVPESIPVIEKYDKNSLNLIETYDLLTIPRISDIYNETIAFPELKEPYATYLITKDTYIHNGTLYILFPTLYSQDSPEYFTGIFAFDIKKNIQFKNRYAFKEQMDIFCVTDEYIFTAPLTGGVIKRFPLNPEQ